MKEETREKKKKKKGARRSRFPFLATSSVLTLLVLSSAACRFSRSPPAKVQELQQTLSTKPSRPSRLEAHPGLDTPKILDPVDSWLVGEKMELSWQTVPAAESYRILVSEDDSLRNPLLEQTIRVRATPEAPVDDGILRRSLKIKAKPGRSLHLRLWATASDGRDSPPASAQIDVHLAVPLPVQPGADETVVAERPQFKWSPVAGASGYEIQVLTKESTRPPLLSTETPGEITTFQAKDPLPRTGSLAFRIRARHESLASEWSPPRTFHYDPFRPRILEPVMNERIVTRQPLITWQRAKKHREENAIVEVNICAIDANGEYQRRFSGETSGLSYRPQEPLTRDREYRVRVRNWGEQFWSEEIFFRVVKDRPHPFPIIPILARPGQNDWRTTLSANGRFLAIFSETNETDTPRREIAILERHPPNDTAFRLLSDAGLKRASNTSAIEWATGKPGIAGAALPTLFVATTRGATSDLHRLEGWSTLAKLPFQITGYVPAISPSARTINGTTRTKLYFEVTRFKENATSSSPWSSSSIDPSIGRTREDGQIWSMSSDGTELQLITTGRDPNVSPDGRTLAFAAQGTQGIEVQLLALDGSQTISRLPAEAGNPIRDLRGIAWSPDSQHIAYARDLGYGHDIVTVHLKSETRPPQVTQVTGSFAPEVFPCFLAPSVLGRSFDGIVFTTLTEGTKSWDVYLASYQK